MNDVTAESIKMQLIFDKKLKEMKEQNKEMEDELFTKSRDYENYKEELKS